MSDTRERLLCAAERLFAIQGIAGTTIRDVNAEAGQRNTSAIRYHFDGMDGLLASLVELRMGDLDEARKLALKELERDSTPDEIVVEDYIAVLVLPLADRVHSDEQWACWVRVLAQLISVNGREHRRLWEGRFDKTTRAVFRKIRKLLPKFADPVWAQRVEDMMMLAIGSLCERAVSLEQHPRVARLSDRAFSENMVVVAAAILRASK